MLTWFIKRRLAAFERRYGYDTSYARELLATDLGAFLTYARLSGVSAYRKDAPLDLYYAAKITAVIAEDCGPCTQLVVAMGLEAGLAPAVLTTILGGDDTTMAPDLALGVRFARAVMAHDVAADPLRDEIVRRWGQRALISLGFAITSSRIFPTLKYALGHGQACHRITVGDAAVVPGRARPAVAAAVAATQ